MEKVSYIQDVFTDYAGNKREFTMAAVSIQDECIDKCVSIGVAAKRVDDTFDAELGKTIAKGKAIKHRTFALYATDPGLINTTMVEALLKQEANYFKQNPGRYLAGYDKDKQTYETNKKAAEILSNMSENAKKAIEFIVNASDEELSDFDYVLENATSAQKLG